MTLEFFERGDGGREYYIGIHINGCSRRDQAPVDWKSRAPRGLARSLVSRSGSLEVENCATDADKCREYNQA